MPALAVTLLLAWGAPAQAAGDAARGLALYESRCIACHAVDRHRVGPAHQGVVGRRAGGAAGYAYSDALASSMLVWQPATLDAWLSDPEHTIPGQRMGYRVADPVDRADLIAYLQTLSPP